MAWRDWIEPREVSQESQLSLSQIVKGEKAQVSHCQKSVSLLTPISSPESPKNPLPGQLATVTLATPATDRAVIPLVRCGDCQHFKPDHINPPQGLGACTVNAAGDRLPWPNLPRRCNQFDIARPALLATCRDACDGMGLDPERLTDWLINQGDPGWLVPAAVRRWAQLINERGYPDER